jgi:hypothetical protein
MDFLQIYHQLNAGERENFTRLANRLMARTFITRHRDDEKRDYYFVERYKDLFSDYFKLSGWDLVHDGALGVFQLVNSYGYNRLSLKLEESIIFLIIRLLYEKKRKEITLTRDVMITVHEIQENYAALGIRDRPITKGALRETIGLLKRFSILENIDRDVTQPDTRLKVYPTILFALKVDDIREIYQRLQQYGSDAAREEDESGEDAD